MNQNKLQKARPALGWMERAFLFYRIALVLLVQVMQVLGTRSSKWIDHRRK